MRKKVVFILGIGRSGSTMLDLILGSNENAFSLGEISKLPQMLAKGNTQIASCTESTFWQDNFSKKELEQLALGMSGHRLKPYFPLKAERFVRELFGIDQIFNNYSLLFEKIKKDVLIDSSKYVSWINNQLSSKEFKTNKIQPILIYLVRDGRAVVNSYLRAYPNNTIENRSKIWLKQSQTNIDFYQSFKGTKKLIRYEELASNPQQCISNVCSLLGLAYSDEMLQFFKHEHHHIAGSRGTNAQIVKYRNQQQDNKILKDQYYSELNFEIKLDLRWKTELSSEKLETFNMVTNNFNKIYEWN
ncbi:MAG: sulfotransferase [Cyanobacterium sp.]